MKKQIALAVLLLAGNPLLAMDSEDSDTEHQENTGSVDQALEFKLLKVVLRIVYGESWKDKMIEESAAMMIFKIEKSAVTVASLIEAPQEDSQQSKSDESEEFEEETEFSRVKDLGNNLKEDKRVLRFYKELLTRLLQVFAIRTQEFGEDLDELGNSIKNNGDPSVKTKN